MKKNKSLFLALLVPFVMNVSCGKSDDSDGEGFTPEAFLSATELSKGSKVKAIELEELPSEINDIGGFYDDGPESSGLLLTGECLSNKLAQIPFKSYDSFLGLGAEVDITECVGEMLGDSGLDVEPSKLRIAAQFGCDGADFSAYDGKTYQEVAELDDSICTDSTTIRELLNLKLNFGAKADVAGHDFSIGVVAYSASATSDGQACTGLVAGGVLTIDDGCVVTDRSITETMRLDGAATEDEGAEDFIQLKTSSIVEAAGANTWYQSGKMLTTINNWTGEVTYAGTSTAPTYSLTNGTETATGSLGSSAAKLQSLSGIAGGIERSVVGSVVEALRNFNETKLHIFSKGSDLK